jgi:hypothetical protein
MVPYERGEKAAKTISNFVREHRLAKFRIFNLILFYSSLEISAFLLNLKHFHGS